MRDERRGSAHARGYDSRWQKVSRGHLRANPLCVCCKANGVIRAASLVDHIEPHRGDMLIFWRPGNRQGLCGECHNRIKPVIERRWEAGEIGAEELSLARPLPEFFPAV